MKPGAILFFRRRCTWLCQVLCLSCLISQAHARPKHVVEKTVPDHFQPLPLDKQKLIGLLADRMRANTEGLLENVDIPELLKLLQTPANGKPAMEREYPGRFLDASASAYEYNQDLHVRSLMDQVASALAAELAKTSPQPAQSISAEDYTIARCNMLGLINYYRVTGEATAFNNARKVADSMAPYLTGTNSDRTSAIASAQIIEPLIQIYRFSGEKHYLDLCRTVATGAALPDIASIRSSAELLPVLYLLNGLAELYQVTGESSYFGAGVRAWQDIVANRLTVTGAPLPLVTAAARTTSDTPGIDACNTISWLQLTYKLLRITGDQRYGEQVEQTLYNQVLAAQDPRNGSISPAVPVNGAKAFSSSISGDSGRCLLAEAKALSLIPLLVWGQYETGIAVNLYTPGRAFFQLGKHGLVQIYTEGNFPQTGSIQLHVEPSGKGQFQFPLRLRVPRWTSSFTVDVADQHLVGVPGQAVVVNRGWRSGDTVRIRMSMDVHVVADHANAAGPENVVLQRGPQVLSLSRKLNNELPDLRAVSPTPTRKGQYQLFDYTGDVPRNWVGDQIYRIAGENANSKQDLLLVPFADATSYQTALRKKLD